MFYLVSYDITDTPRRTRVAKILKDFGDRVQYSVFECLMDRALLEKLEKRLKKVMLESEDSIRVYSLCGTCQKEIMVMGVGEVVRDEKSYIL